MKGPNKMTPEYVRSLPTVGDEDLLYNYGGHMSDEVRVGQDVYKFYGGKGGNWEKIFTIPDDLYQDATKTSTPSQSSNTYVPSSGGGGSGRVGPLLDPGMNVGPYPFRNDYAPMLAAEYQAPAAQDFSAYMAPNSPFSGGAPAVYGQSRFPGDPDAPPQTPMPQNIGGLLYQPWTTEYQQAFVPDDLWTYRPIQMGVKSPGYNPPNIPVEVIEVEEEDPES